MEILIHILMGGIGGAMPTLSHLAASLTQNDNQPLPNIGFYIGIAIYFAIGAAVSCGFKKENDKKSDYLIRGIAAPAIIASVLAGSSPNQTNIQNDPHIRNSSKLSMLSSANAATKDPYTWDEINNARDIDSKKYRILDIVISFHPFDIIPPEGNIKIYIPDQFGSMTPVASTTFGLHTISVQAPKKSFNAIVEYSYGGETYKKELTIENKGSMSDFFVSLSININTKSNFWGDLKWSLGQNRIGSVKDITISPSYDF
ncbi:hypothetical protein JK203_11525 [Gluconobacter cerinus]|uniref:hypothetical protein n=1 Tax=Gluconobacter cerinus TaxID=38307 RepID=UPI001B8CFB58|nr:hypothetical protein [Gluconobacter cerinus]MBS1041468.1 hypothetical protein [Gluconobacter cerinus]MBS1048056.1 hypothetical protein [Gluconobacter cerinus]